MHQTLKSANFFVGEGIFASEIGDQMRTECSANQLAFGEVSGRRIIADFASGTITSDVDALPLGAVLAVSAMPAQPILSNMTFVPWCYSV